MEYNKLYNEDCLDTMSRMPDASIDLVVTSPPYDSLRNYNGYSFDFENTAKELYRVIKAGGVVVWVVGDATVNGTETGTSFKQALYFKEIGFNLHDTMIFKKRNPVPQIYRRRYTNEFEYMFVFSKGQVEKHNPIMTPCLHAGLELNGTTYKNYSRHEQKRSKMANPVKSEKIKGNIWEYVVGGGNSVACGTKHPAAFPEKLASDHIITWSNEGDVVYDPFLGSGTTAKCAIMHKRKYIGSEISKQYFEMAIERIKDFVTREIGDD